MKQKILLAIRVAVSVILMAALIYIMRDSIPKMLDAVKSMPIGIVFSGFLLFVCSVAIASFRLKILLATQGMFLDIIHIIKLTFVGYFFSSFLPTSVGGDVVKAFYISKASDKAMHSYTTVFIDRFFGMWTLFLMGAVALFYAKEIPKYHMDWLLLFLLIASGIFVVFLFNKRFAKILTSFLAPFVPEKIEEKIKEVYNAMHNFKEYKLEIMWCIFIAVAGQVTAFFAVYIFALGLNSYIPLKFILLAMPVASIVSMLPSLYGMGPREMSMVIILSPFIGKDKALAIAFLWLALLLAIALVGGIIHMFTGQYKIRTIDLSR